MSKSNKVAAIIGVWMLALLLTVFVVFGALYINCPEYEWAKKLSDFGWSFGFGIIILGVIWVACYALLHMIKKL